ncbi:MAG: VOC family protein [Saprospiraceae bacterium]|nr:VOC family protein [Saprospiraceae bacterium]
MNIKSIYINLPVKDLSKTRDFWTQLGFAFNEQFSDEKALCLILKEGSIYSMLITHEFFAGFTNRPVSDSSSTEVLIAIEVDSKEKVDAMVHTALSNGATRYRESADHEWMYYDSFADPDGHQWEVLYTDPSKMKV